MYRNCTSIKLGKGESPPSQTIQPGRCGPLLFLLCRPEGQGSGRVGQASEVTSGPGSRRPLSRDVLSHSRLGALTLGPSLHFLCFQRVSANQPLLAVRPSPVADTPVKNMELSNRKAGGPAPPSVTFDLKHRDDSCLAPSTQPPFSQRASRMSLIYCLSLKEP